MTLISEKTITLLVSVFAFFIVNTVIGATPVQASSLGYDPQLIPGLGLKGINKSINEVTQIANSQNQPGDDPGNSTAKNSNTVVQFASNQDPTPGTPDYGTISKSDPKAQFASNQN